MQFKRAGYISANYAPHIEFNVCDPIPTRLSTFIDMHGL